MGKLKRALTLFLVFLIGFSCVACDSMGNNSNNDNNDDANSGYIPPSKQTITADTNIDTIISEKLTATELLSAVRDLDKMDFGGNISNYSARVYEKAAYGAVTESVTYTEKLDGDKYERFQQGRNSSYYKIVEDRFLEIYFSNFEYAYVSDYTNYGPDLKASAINDCLSECNLEFNEKNAYVLTLVENSELTEYVTEFSGEVKFVDKKIASFEIKFKANDSLDYNELKVLFYNYGKTTINIPQFEPPYVPPADDDEDIEEVIAPSITYGYSSGADTPYVNAIITLVNKWNAEQYDANNPLKNFKVYTTPVASDSAVALMGSPNQPDLMEIADKNSQAVIVSGKAEAINTTEVDVSSISATSLDRYYSGKIGDKFSPYTPDAKLYGVPLTTSPAMLFYNEEIFKQVGITVISLSEEEALAAGFGAYGYHVYEALPAGYSGASTTYNEIDLQGNMISNVTGYRVFNNKVPMSIEELYALSAVLTRAYNPSVPTETGFNSEYFSPFVWTVGGDCLAYNELTGRLEFSLADDTPNYLVTAPISIPGGKSYKAGEILEYSDKIRVANAVSADNAQIKTAIYNGVLYALPSTQKVFSQFIAASVTKGTDVGYNASEAAAAATAGLEQIKGFGVAYNPTQLDYVPNFTSSKSAMIIRGYSDVANKLTGSFGQGVNICPTPQYKEYNADGTIKTVNGTQIKGYRSTWDNQNATYLNSGSQMKDEAITFLKWLMEDEQQMAIAESAYYITTNTQGADALVNSSAYKTAIAEQYREGYNVDALLEAAKYSSAPDWTYTSDNGEWVNTWSVPLNRQVRTGDATIYYLFYAQDSAGKTIPQLTNEQVQGEDVKNIEIVHHKTFQ